MRRKRVYRLCGLTVTAAAVGIMAACGGTGSGGLDVADGGIRGTGSSVGPVSGFGSVFVNGVKFTTDGDVAGDDGIGTESQLVEGMILRIDGEWSTSNLGEAFTVEYDDTLRGVMEIVSPWDPITRTATVQILGQSVRIDAQTVVKGAVVETLAGGVFVRMSGWRLPDGTFRASHLGLRNAGNTDAFGDLDRVELEGTIVELSATEFRIGTQLVNYSGAVADGMELADLANGVAVEVEGFIVGNTLMADEIRPDDSRRYRSSTDSDIEFMGPVSSDYNQATATLSVNGIVVTVTDTTEFDGLTGPEDLVEGVLVEVDGAFIEDGSVTADEIELREADAQLIGGPAQQIDYTARQFTVGGVRVQVTPLTVITDDDDSQRLVLEDLAAYVELEIDGAQRLDENGEAYLDAFKVERGDDEPSGDFELVGEISEMINDRIRVLGVDLFITTDTEFDGILRSELQALVDSGARPKVEVAYSPSATGYDIDEIELEEDDND